MAKERRQLPLSSISCSSIAAAITTALFLLQQLEAAADANNSRRGLSLSLVHRDSIHSPSYPGPLTDLQRLERSISFSRFSSASSLVPLDENDMCGIAPPVSSFGGFYVVTLAMGTPKKVFWLVLDTGSDVTWTQCVPSEPQFRQAHPLFDPAGSSSFDYVNPEEEECEMPSYRLGQQYCAYSLTYGSGERTSGYLGQEMFHFYSPELAGGILSLPDVKFGCSHASEGRLFSPSHDGILGMGGGPLSFAQQVGGYYDGRFSYCLVDGSHPSTLLFGDDMIKMVGDVQTTPFLTTASESHYYLSLEDITWSGLSLGLNAEVYEPGDLLQRGTVIDSGSVGFLYYPAFDALGEIMSAYFGLYDHTPFDMSAVSPFPLEICYEDTKPLSLREDVSLKYRFRGPAFLDVPSKYLFTRISDHQPPYFCLSMVRHNKRTLIGFWQQRNVRFTYDLKNEVLQFVPETCDPSAGTSGD